MTAEAAPETTVAAASAPLAPPSVATAPLGTGGPRPAASTLDLILEWIGPVDGRSILDVGCGDGALARALVRRGARVTGVDPLAEALEAARRRVPEATFVEGGAERLAFPDGAFDSVVFLNSLHHVPEPLMEAALAEALRVSRGPVLVVEPLAEGPFFEAMRPVEDETRIRAAAQAALGAVEGRGVGRLLRGGEYDDVRRFADVDAFLAKVVAVDPSRATLAVEAREEVAALMARHGKAEGADVLLPQPHRAHLLARLER